MIIVVRGIPAPQGSKSSKGVNKVTGKVNMVESSKTGVDLWRGDVMRAAREIVEANPAAFPLVGALAASMVFSRRRPAIHYRTGRNAHLLRDSAPSRPATKPDLSKLIRSTEDALTVAGLWKDDALVVEYRRLAKVWCNEDPDSLDTPGAKIVITPQ